MPTTVSISTTVGQFSFFVCGSPTPPVGLVSRQIGFGARALSNKS